MINCIVFDIGNVLLDFKPVDYLKNLFPAGVDVDEIFAQVFQSREWVELDRGSLTQEEFIGIISERHPKNSDSIWKCMEGWMNMLTPKEDTLELLNKLDFEKYKILLLSNFHMLAYEHIIDKYDFFKKFHGGIISYRENLVKPDAEIFHCLADKYALIPEETVFIDDTLANVEAAAKLGFKIIHFQNAGQLYDELREYNILR